MEQENDHMDELVRKAAENYPLKTDISNWEDVRKKLYGKDDHERAIPVFFIYALLVAVLFTAGWFGYRYFSPRSAGVTAKDIQNNLPVQEKISSTATSPSSVNQVPDKNTAATIFKHQDQAIAGNLRSAHVIKKQNNSAVEPQLTEGDKQTSLNSNNKDRDKLQDNENSTTGKSSIVDNGKNEKKEKDVKKPEQKIEEPIQPAVNGQTNNENTNVTVTNKSTATSKKENKKENYFYAGLIVEPDINTVKFQSLKNVGLNAGGILGYQLNKHFAVETGIMLDKKFYYSDGKYFNTAKIALPAYGKITKVDGNCQMVEIPVNLRYNFKPGKRSQLFATAGMSSYFMKKESYEYTIISTGAPYDKYASYNTASDYWLSVVNVSAGYSRPIGKDYDLRVEPYIKIPVKGVGLGSLPITSIGVNLGVTKKIF